MREEHKRKPDAGLTSVFAEARTGLLRATLLFGSIAVALALIVVPAADRQAKLMVGDGRDKLDQMTTGSIRTPDAGRYTLLHSVLQDPSAGPCLLFADGTQRGAC